MPANRSWHDYNESLIERGRVLTDTGFLKPPNDEIKKMNEGKVGAPFQYSDSFIQFLASLKIDFKIPYSTVQGMYSAWIIRLYQDRRKCILHI